MAMKSSIILGVLGVCLGSPFNNPDYPEYSYQQPLAEERSSQAYEPPQLQVLDDKRYDSRYEASEDQYYYDDEEEDNLNSIPGEAGVDFPILGEIPRTSFGCADKLPGFYADMETDCQVWHYCKTDGLLDSFLCPNGTIYNQENRVCEWWFNVKCEDNAKFDEINADLYIVPEKDLQEYQVAEQRIYRQQQEQSKEYNRPVYQQEGYQQ